VHSNIIVRSARLSDANSISDLISQYAIQGIMLARSVESIVEGIRNFIVAESNDQIVGCCTVSFFTEELAEIRSVAVKIDLRGKGIGSLLIEEAEKILKEEGIKYVFALTLSEPFFAKQGYHRVEKTKFPQKIWRDCLGCPKIMQCDEVAMEKELSPRL
jgi:amino-acid N-acetyltransferase